MAKALKHYQSLLSAQRDKLFAKYDIESLAFFGSVSRGDQTRKSDLDMLVSFTRPVGIEFIDLAEELETLFGIKVDLVSKNAIKDRYFLHIEKELRYV